jgi:hypothetical protein
MKQVSRNKYHEFLSKHYYVTRHVCDSLVLHIDSTGKTIARTIFTKSKTEFYIK